MRDGHAHERVEVVVGVKEALEVREQVAQSLLAVRRRVDDLARRRVGELGAGHVADAGFGPADRRDHLLEQPGRERAALDPKRLEAFRQRPPVGENLLRRRVGVPRVVGQGAVELVAGGDDVLDLAREPRLLEPDGAEQDRLIRDERAGALEVGERGPGADDALKHCLRL